MRRAAVLLVVVVTACSSGHKQSESPPTTAAARSSTSSSAAATSSTLTVTPTTTTSTSVPKATTTTANASAVRILSFTGPGLVACNAPTSVQLGWTTTGATKVVLKIDDQQFATFTTPKFAGLEYFPCDGKAHRYTLVAAGAGGATATRTITVRNGG